MNLTFKLSRIDLVNELSKHLLFLMKLRKYICIVLEEVSME